MSSSIPTGKLESTVAASFFAGVLLCQTILVGRKLTLKPARIAIFVQFCLVLLRNVTIIFLITDPYVDCMALSVIGLIFYALWIIALQSVVFLRSLAFLHMEWERTILKIVMGVLWAVQLGLRAYQMSVLQVTSLPGEFCKTKNIGVDVSYYNFAFLMAAESALLLPFLYACFKSYIYGNAKKNAAKWIRLCVVNIAVTGSIILIEIIARILAPSAPNSPPFPQMIPYFNVMFVMINFYEANIVVLILEDLKQTMLGAYKTSKHSGGTSDTGNLSLPATSVLMNSGRSSHAGVQIFGQSGH